MDFPFSNGCTDAKFHHKPCGQRLLFFGKPDVQKIENKLFCSIPSKIHSHKPDIHVLLKNAINLKNPKMIEMFARKVTEGWIAVGNEVIFLNDKKFYEHSTGLTN